METVQREQKRGIPCATHEGYELIACYLCGSFESVSYLSAKDRLHEIDGKFNIVKCKTCGLIYLNPRPVQERMARYYPEDYLSHQFTLHGHASSLRDRLFRNMVVQTEKKKIHTIDAVYALDAKTNVLDVGCGTGLFLYLLRDMKKCNVHGVEIGKEAAQCAKENLGLDLLQCTLLETQFQDSCFDLITMWHYLEHEYHPNETLRECHRILKDEGLMVIQLPNIESIEAKFFRNRWFNLDAPRHVIHFSPSTITKMLSKNGFEIIKFKYSIDSPGFAGSLQYILGLNLFSDVKKHLFAINFFYFFSMPFAFLTGVLKKSDWMTIVARKK